MTFIPNIPLVAPSVSKPPNPPMDRCRGLYCDENGWHDIDKNGNIKDISYCDDLGEINTQEELDNLTSLSTGWAKFTTTNQFITVDNMTQYKWLLNGGSSEAQFLLYTLKDNNGAFVQFLINSNYTYSECYWREGFSDGSTVQYGGSFKLTDLFTTGMLPTNTHQTMSDEYDPDSLAVSSNISGMQGKLPASYDAVKKYIDDKSINFKGEGAPTTSTEGAVGCLYMDTLTGDIYKCVDLEEEWEATPSGSELIAIYYIWEKMLDKMDYTPIINETTAEYQHTQNYMPALEEFTDELLNGANGNVISSSNNKLSPFFEVPAGKKFIAQHFANANPTYAAIRTFAPYDAEKNIIASSVVENAPTATIYDIPPEAKYLRICLMKGYINDFAKYKTMFVVNDDGSLLSEYVENTTQLVGEEKKELQGDIFVNGVNLSEDAHKKIKEKLGDITDDDLTKVSPKHKKSARVSALSQMFTSYESTNADYIAIENTYLTTAKKTEWLYGLYDALMAEYPDYITRTQIATTAAPTLPVYSKNDGTTQRTDITSESVFPIYRYDFAPPISNTTITHTSRYDQKVELPKILYTTGIHGGEYRQVIAAFRFFKMLCEKWRDYELLADLRWNAHFVVVPLTNPFGFNYPSGRYDANGNDVSKRNERNIDISGNFPSDNYVENEGNEYKYGTQALTEPGSIALYDIITNEDFILSLDNHTFNYLAGAANTDKKAGYIIANHAKENSINFWFKISRWINQSVRKLSPAIDKTYDGYDMAQVWTDGRQQMLCNTFRSVSANIEMTIGIDPAKTKNEDGTTAMAEETQAFCVDQLAVVFYEALNDFYTY